MARSLKHRLRCKELAGYWVCCQCKRERGYTLSHPIAYGACPKCHHVRCAPFEVKERKNPTRFNRGDVV